MKSFFVLLVGFLLVLVFAGEVQSSHYRGGTISYKPNATSPYSLDFTFRLSFRQGAIYCDSYRVANSLAPSGWSPSTWRVTRYYWSYYSSSSSGTANIYCSAFNAQEDWSEGYGNFTFSGSYSDDWWSVRITDGGDWISGITHSNPYDDMQLEAKVNRTVSGAFNNSSPVSSLPLTVYVYQGIPSVIRIPVEDPDGDTVRCRKARYQECYRGMCTYFPYGVLDEGNCTLSYNGGGSVGQLFPIILKLEDFPSGTTQFNSPNSSLGSVDLQFVVHVVNPSDMVRIQGGGSSGRLQVLHNRVWGTVCDDGWSMTNTHVVCRQLGFAGGLSYHNSGGGSGQIWLDDVRCSGNESAIQQCSHYGWGNHDCGHGEDVFVSCYHDECNNYTVLNTSDRAASYRGITYKCDYYDITPGWYRLMGDAGTVMSTWCIDSYHCGTNYPGWMQGSNPTQAEGVVTRRVCYSYSSNCCYWNNNIQVRNCGGFYVYDLVRTPTCNLRYCGNGNSSTNNTCTSSPCRNGGTCVTAYNGYRCYCPSGYTGRQCEAYTYPCNSNPCRNGGTCHGGYGWYNCSCPYGYTGQQCQSYVNFCASWPCRNGGTCINNYNHGYNCSCPFGFTGPQCETNLKTSVTCGENFMQIDLLDHYFPGLDWRTLHLKNTTCRATKTAYTMRLRAPLDGCGVTYVEHDKKITFWNEVRNELVPWPGWGGNLSDITRGENPVIPFYCEYGREKIVSTNFSPSKKRVYASEGSYGNFTFTMDLYYTSSYRTPYSVFAYPVVVYPNQPLWVQYEVKNTNADLVVFAENCRATTTTNPDSYPQHVFLKRGCVRDPTMDYWYNPYSNVQRFSIRSFRFVYSNKFLVYLHCELIVCHRNSTNSRCAQGCISGFRRRREAIDGSNTYRLSAGPLKGPQTGTDQQDGEETSSANTATIGSVSALAVVGLLVAVVLSMKMYYTRRKRVPPKETPPPAIVMGDTLDMSQTVNSYEQHVMEDGERMEIEI